MKAFSLTFTAAAFALVTAVAGGALADVPPPDACSGAVGSACTNAGPNADQAGVCANGMCPHATFGGAGGTGTSESPCVLCEPTSTTSSSSSSSSGSGAGGSSSTSSGGSSSSCAIGARTSDGMIAGSMLMIGLGVLLADRRRRRRG